MAPVFVNFKPLSAKNTIKGMFIAKIKIISSHTLPWVNKITSNKEGKQSFGLSSSYRSRVKNKKIVLHAM